MLLGVPLLIATRAPWPCALARARAAEPAAALSDRVAALSNKFTIFGESRDRGGAATRAPAGEGVVVYPAGLCRRLRSAFVPLFVRLSVCLSGSARSAGTGVSP